MKTYLGNWEVGTMIDRADELMTHDNSTLEAEVAAAGMAAQEKQNLMPELPREFHRSVEKLEREIQSLEAQREGLQRELKENHELVHQCLKLLAHLIKALT